MKSKKSLIAAIGGCTVGVVNGLLGAGGGMLAVPLLKRLGGNVKKAHATSIAVILPLSAVSAGIYLYTGRVTVADALPFIPAGLIGAVLGGWLLGKIPDKWLRRLFGAFMIWAGIRLMMR